MCGSSEAYGELRGLGALEGAARVNREQGVGARGFSVARRWGRLEDFRIGGFLGLRGSPPASLRGSEYLYPSRGQGIGTRINA